MRGKEQESIIAGPQAADPNKVDPFRHMLGYARVSTADQNPQMQIDALVVAGVPLGNIYHEKVSGAAKTRPQFDAMMRELRAGDVVVTWKLDRLGRTTRQVLDTIATIAERGASLRILTQHFDSTTPMGKAMLGFFALISELERDLAIERTRAGLAAARARGRVGGRRLSYTEKQIEEAAARFRAGESLKVIRESVKNRHGKMITVLRLSQRIAEFEERKAKEDAERKP